MSLKQMRVKQVCDTYTLTWLTGTGFGRVTQLSLGLKNHKTLNLNNKMVTKLCLVCTISFSDYVQRRKNALLIQIGVKIVRDIE